MSHWLIKTEPSTWSWQDQQRQTRTAWDGVRNYQAANTLKAMSVGDLCLFYHSVKDKKIMGIVSVTKSYYPDPSDETGRFGMVDVSYKESFLNPVSLETIKHHPMLQHLALVRQSRLSVMPIDQDSWDIILNLSQQA